MFFSVYVVCIVYWKRRPPQSWLRTCTSPIDSDPRRRTSYGADPGAPEEVSSTRHSDHGWILLSPYHPAQHPREPTGSRRDITPLPLAGPPRGPDAWRTEQAWPHNEPVAATKAETLTSAQGGPSRALPAGPVTVADPAVPAAMSVSSSLSLSSSRSPRPRGGADPQGGPGRNW